MRSLLPVMLLLAGCTGSTAVDEGVVLRIADDGSWTPKEYELPESKGDWNTTSVILETPGPVECAILAPVFSRLASQGCVNISLRVAGAEERTVALPLATAHGCTALHVWEGQEEYNEHGKEKPGRHLWMRARVGEGGTVRFVGFEYGFLEMEKPMPLDAKKEPHVEKRPSADGMPPLGEWKGKRPKYVVWSDETARAFLAREDVRKLSPFCELRTTNSVLVADAVKALLRLRTLMPGRVVLSLALEDTPTLKKRDFVKTATFRYLQRMASNNHWDEGKTLTRSQAEEILALLWKARGLSGAEMWDHSLARGPGGHPHLPGPSASLAVRTPANKGPIIHESYHFSTGLRLFRYSREDTTYVIPPQNRKRLIEILEELQDEGRVKFW